MNRVAYFFAESLVARRPRENGDPVSFADQTQKSLETVVTAFRTIATRITTLFAISAAMSAFAPNAAALTAQAIHNFNVPAHITYTTSSSGSLGIGGVTGGGSGQPVIFTSLTPSVCSIATTNATTTTIYTAYTGTCTVTASQAGDANYSPAPTLTKTTTVDPATAPIVITPVPAQIIGAPPVTLNATGAPTGNPLVWTSITPANCTVNGNVVTLLATPSCGLQVTQAGNALYKDGQNAVNITILHKTQNLNYASATTATVGGTPFAITASVTSGLPVTLAAISQVGICSLNGNIVTPLAAGKCQISFNQAGDSVWSPIPQFVLNITINPKPQAITFAAIPKKLLSDSPLTLTATADSGYAVLFVSKTQSICTTTDTGAVSLIAAGTCTIQAQQAGDTTTWAAAANVNRSFSVGKVPQSITFATLTAKNITDAPFAIAPTASSGLAVTLTSTNTSVCTIANGTITIVGAGTCSIAATQAGNNYYLAAAKITRSFAVNKTLQVITFVPIGAQTMATASITADATATSGLTVTLTSNTTSVCTVSGFTVTIKAAGRCTLAATQAGDANFAAATKVTQSFNITKIAQTITFAALTAKPLNASPVTLTATASSGLAVTFSTNSTAVCSISGTSVTLLGTGTCMITASQAGNATYAAAPNVAHSFAVQKNSQTITFGALASVPVGASPLTVSATASSGLAVAFTSKTAAVCTVSGNTVTLLKAGTCTLAANQAGSTSYLAAPQVTQSFVVTAGGLLSQIITNFSAPASLNYSAGLTFPISATPGASGVAVVFGSNTPSVCTVSGSTVSVLTAGTCALTADEAGNGAYNPAPQVTANVTINPLGQTITFAAIPAHYATDAPFAVTATASSGLPVSFLSFTTGVCTVSGNMVSIVTAGTCILAADQFGDATYAAASEVTQSFAVTISVPLTLATRIAAGGYHACALTTLGGVMCWGWNELGQLGNGSTTNSSYPVNVVGLTSGVVMIGGGYAHTCALMAADGGVQCWGNNSAGQLGDGTTTQRNTPVQVSNLTGAVAITGGIQHSCALLGNGGVKCWGINANNELGDGSGIASAVPVDVPGLASGVAAISAENAHTCALMTADGSVRCWGQDYHGQLGDGGNGVPFAPVIVTGLTGAKQVYAGGYHTCAQTSTNGLQCWGANTVGAIGDGNPADHPAPTDVPGLTSGVSTAAASLYGTCALLTDSSVQCTGGTYHRTDTPSPVTGLNANQVAIASGFNFSCALGQYGAVQCWGNNVYGELGDATVIGRDDAALVAGFTGGTANSQTISFAAIPDHGYSDPPFAVTATASSGLTVGLVSITPSVCSVSGNTVTLIAGGTCTIAANQIGDANNLPAPQVTQSFNVSATQQSQTINGFAPPGSVYLTGNTLTLTATASSNLPVSYGTTTPGICTASANVITFLAAGTCTVTADQAGNGGYLPAPHLSADIAVLALNTQAITGLAVDTPSPVPYSAGLQFGVTAQGGGSSAPVVFGIAQTSSGICTIAGNIVTVLTAGTCTVTADQAGDATYAAAVRVTLDVIIDRLSQSITFATIPDHQMGDQAFTVTAVASSGLAVTFASQTSNVCTVAGGNTVTILTTGTCTIAADQAGNANYGPAAQVTQSFSVSQKVRKLYYVHPDHLGTPRIITDPTSNSVVWAWDNIDPFGANLPNENPSNTGNMFKYNFRFPGQYADAETGLFYNYMRDYDPSIGRYVQSDPVGLSGGLNTFGYSGGNPLNNRDPMGLDFWGGVGNGLKNVAIGAGLIAVAVVALPEVVVASLLVAGSGWAGYNVGKGGYESFTGTSWSTRENLTYEQLSTARGEFVVDVATAGLAKGLRVKGSANSCPTNAAPAFTEVANATAKRSRYPNLSADITANDFQSNLLANGYQIVKQSSGSNGPVTVLSNGTKTYTVYTATSTGEVSAQATNSAGQILSKIRLTP